MEFIIVRLMDNQKKSTIAMSLMLPNLTKTISIFNGKTGDTDAAAKWLNVLKTAAQLNNWPHSSTLETERSYLEGEARNWYLSHMSEFVTFDKFVKSLSPCL